MLESAPCGASALESSFELLSLGARLSTQREREWSLVRGPQARSSLVVSLRTELAVRTEFLMGIGDEQGSKTAQIGPKILKRYICTSYGLEGYVWNPHIIFGRTSMFNGH